MEDQPVRAEYLHYGFSGSSNTSIFATCGFGPFNVVCGSNVSSSNHNVDVVRLGVNYGTSALAADMPGEAPPAAEPVPNWTGFYIGTNGGYGWSKDSTTAAPFQNIPPIFGKTLIPFFTLSNPVNGAVFGG